jgi:hypothetical protein
MAESGVLINSGVQTAQAGNKVGIEIYHKNNKNMDLVKKKTPTNHSTNYQNLNNHYGFSTTNQNTKLRGFNGSSGNQDKLIYAVADIGK